jgi:8-oxo-dGTP diphosphatase
VQLNVFLVENFSGQAKGLQDQEIRWINVDELDRFEFPKANRTIITAIQLPPCYAIIDDTDEPLLFAKLQKMLSNGVKLIQARLKNSSAGTVNAFLKQAYPLCKQHGAWLLVNSAVRQSDAVQVDGIHLTSHDLLAITRRPENMRWVSASCHNLEQLQQAQRIGVDFVVLAPVLPTQSHPGVQTLGWQQFATLVAEVNIPVYALGGMSLANLMSARQVGAQGIAGISAFLN